jgi:hypothetical protein
MTVGELSALLVDVPLSAELLVEVRDDNFGRALPLTSVRYDSYSNTVTLQEPE